MAPAPGELIRYVDKTFVKENYMDWLSFSIALAGLLSTIIVSIVGLYFTNRARTQNYRSCLYQKQLDLIVDIIDLMQLLELDLALVIYSKSDQDRNKYLSIFNEHFLKFSETQRIGSSLLSIDLYGQITKTNTLAQSIVIKINDGGGNIDDLNKLKAFNVQFALLAREFMGVEKLSEQTVKLFTKRKEISGLTNLDNNALVKIVEEANRKLNDIEKPSE
jgi:hypothetical protein